MYKDDHEEEILQSDGETVKTVMINEASPLLNTLTDLKVPPEGFGLEETSTVSRVRMRMGSAMIILGKQQRFGRLDTAFRQKLERKKGRVGQHVQRGTMPLQCRWGRQLEWRREHSIGLG